MSVSRHDRAQIPRPGLEPSTGSDADRLPWIDRLRLCVIAGVIVMHASTAYVVNVGWYYEERTTSIVAIVALSFPMDAALIFGLGPLYLVAGWLASRSVSRHGPAAFVRSRLLRLGLPTVVFLGLIGPLAAYLGSRAEGRAQPWRSFVWPAVRDRDLGPMWFVAALLAFSVGYGLYRQFRTTPALARTSLTTGRLAIWVLAIGAADFAVWLRWSYSSVSIWNLNWAHWPQSAGMFLLGAVAYERGWLDEVPVSVARHCRRATWLGLVLLVAVAVVSVVMGGDYAGLAGGWHWRTGIFALLDGLITVGLGIWVVAAFQRRWNAPLSVLTTRTARSSYAAYVFHPVVLVVISAALRPLSWPPEAKFVVLAAVGLPACFAIGHVLTRLRLVNRVL